MTREPEFPNLSTPFLMAMPQPTPFAGPAPSIPTATSLPPQPAPPPPTMAETSAADSGIVLGDRGFMSSRFPSRTSSLGFGPKPKPSTTITNGLPVSASMHELGASQYSIPDTSVAAEPTAEPTVPLQSIEWVEGYPRLVGGRKRALLIGIHYTGQAGELRGCHADVEAVREFLTSRYGFTAEEMLVLTDDPANAVCEYLWPSKRAILAAMMWLVDGAQPGDSLFLHFSGHGGQQQDTDGDEDDGYDETIYPVDHATAGMIVDDEMNAILVHPLPAGARLTALFDSCHSGTALDLQVVYKADGRVEKRKGKANRILTAAADAAREAFHGAGPGVLMRGAVEMFKEAMAPEKSAMTLARVQREKGSQGTVVMFAGCKDSQKSVDVEIAGRATGAMSFALLATLRARGGQSYAQVLASTRDTLRKGYSQVPQLSAAAAIDIHQLFVL